MVVLSSEADRFGAAPDIGASEYQGHGFTLTVTDSHPGPSLLPGAWYTIPITASGASVTQTLSVDLLVGGARVWLPIVFKQG